jgi:sulfonate transport system substrate-binding protein
VLNVGDQGAQLQQPLQLSGQIPTPAYSVNFVSLSDAAQVDEAFESGKLDVTVSDDTSAIQTAAAGVKAVVIGVERFTGPRILLVARPGSGIKTLAQLKGKSVAFTTGTTTQGLLLRALNKAGLSESQIKPVDLPDTSVYPALSSGKVDAAVIYDFYWGAYKAAHPGAIELLNAGIDLKPNYAYSLLLASKAALQNPAKAAALSDFLVRLARASQWGAQNETAYVNGYFVGYLQMTLAQGLQYFKSQGPGVWVPVTTALQAAQQGQANLFYKAGYFKKPVNLASQFNWKSIAPFNAAVKKASEGS